MFSSLIPNPNREIFFFFFCFENISSPFLPLSLTSHSMPVPFKGYLHSLLACSCPFLFSSISCCNFSPSFVTHILSLIQVSRPTPRGFLAFVSENFRSRRFHDQDSTSRDQWSRTIHCSLHLYTDIPSVFLSVKEREFTYMAPISIRLIS